jgi:hypothetical protein
MQIINALLALAILLGIVTFGIGSVWLSLNRTPRTGGFPLTRKKGGHF